MGDWKPASTNQPGKEYPRVNSEGRVRFRVVAPDAQSVTVSFRASSTFTRSEDGAWVGYTRPLDEGFHYYTIYIDGKVKLVFVSYGGKELVRLHPTALQMN